MISNGNYNYSLEYDNNSHNYYHEYELKIHFYEIIVTSIEYNTHSIMYTSINLYIYIFYRFIN